MTGPRKQTFIVLGLEKAEGAFKGMRSLKIASSILLVAFGFGCKEEPSAKQLITKNVIWNEAIEYDATWPNGTNKKEGSGTYSHLLKYSHSPINLGELKYPYLAVAHQFAEGSEGKVTIYISELEEVSKTDIRKSDTLWDVKIMKSIQCPDTPVTWRDGSPILDAPIYSLYCISSVGVSRLRTTGDLLQQGLEMGSVNAGSRYLQNRGIVLRGTKP